MTRRPRTLLTLLALPLALGLLSPFGCVRRVGGDALSGGSTTKGDAAQTDDSDPENDPESDDESEEQPTDTLPPDAGPPVVDSGAPEGDAGPPSDLEPVFEGSAEPIPPAVQAEMTGLSWKPELDCPSFDELRLVRVSHWDFEGEVRQGELVVAASVADDVIAAFRALFEAGFPIERMVRVDAYGADDDASMAANNTSAFNCRLTTSGTRLSDHSFGTAIDINPVQNPYVTSGGTVYPPAGAAFVDRTNVRQGMIVRPGPAIDAFAAIGWPWGGDWRGTKDYQHFSESGR